MLTRLGAARFTPDHNDALRLKDIGGVTQDRANGVVGWVEAATGPTRQPI
jgi:hypothetical protein